MIDLSRYSSDQAFTATAFIISGCQVSRLAGAPQEPHLREARSFLRPALTFGWD